MKESKRIFYLDGENLFHRITDVLFQNKLIKNRRDLTKYDFRYFISEIIGAELSPDDDIRYYGTKLKLLKSDKNLFKRSQDMMIHKRTWGQSLANQKIEFISAGQLKVRDTKPCQKCGYRGEVFQEKGVDVRLAVDLVKDSFTKPKSMAYIVSSDTDLLPAINVAKEQNFKMCYVCMSTDLNWALYKACGQVSTFSDKVIVEAFKRANK
jgi:uncharacterized LabA/DUF88 family protein